MKTTIRNLFLLFLLAGFASCADNLVTEPLAPESMTESDSFVTEFIVTLPELVEETETADTRTAFTFPTTGGFSTSWAAGDTIGIFPSSGGQVEFPISGTGSSAQFNGGGWGLKTSYTYAAYYPFSKGNYYRNNKTILMDYTGQVQKYNNSHNHLGSYDFLASKPVTPSGGSVNITTERLGSVLMLEITVPESDYYTEIELISDNNPFVTKAELNISNSNPLVNRIETNRVIRLKFQEGGEYVSKNRVLTAYMMVYPVGEVNPKVVLHGKKGAYQGTLNRSMNLVAKTKFTRQATMEEGLRLTNAKLIAAAEANEGVDFTAYKDDATGYVDVNAAREMLGMVKSIDVSGKYDRTVCDEIGIFYNLESLDCSNNFLDHLDVSKNKALKTLICRNNDLRDLDLRGNVALTELNVYYNYFASLDVTHNPQLRHLNCNGNQLTFLDISYNSRLNTLDCGRNSLTSLELSHNSNLYELYCGNNKFKTLDLSNNLYLEKLYCESNEIESLDLSYNSRLQTLVCKYNKLISLGLTNNTKLEELDCQGNDITGLYLVDNVKTTLKTVNASNCKNLKTIYGGGTQEEPGVLSTLTLTGCSALDYLDCKYNQLTALNLSSATILTLLYCNDNLMSSLDIRNCTSLQLKNVLCGHQWTSISRTSSRKLTLYITSANGSASDLRNTTTTGANYNVTVVTQ